MEQCTIYHHMGDSRERKLTKKSLLIPLDAFGGEPQLLGSLHHAVGIGALFIRACHLADFSDGDRQAVLFGNGGQAGSTAVGNIVLFDTVVFHVVILSLIF